MQSPATDDISIELAYINMYKFFECYPLSEALQLTETMIATAWKKKCWKKEPCDLLLFMRQLDVLCTAALIIHYEKEEKAAAILQMPVSGQPDISIQAHYIHPRFSGTIWNCFPRHLNSRQYHNPYRVFKKFAHTLPEREWRKALQLLLEYALSNDPFDAACSSYNLLFIRCRLLQLVEACHLIVVRTKPFSG